MRQVKVSLVAAMLVVLLVGLFVQSGAARAASSKPTITCNGTWNQINGPNTGTGTYPNLNGVAAISPNDVWAVGDEEINNTLSPLAIHWDGTAWSIISIPDPSPTTQTQLFGVAAVSTSDVWAVGYYFNANNSNTIPFIEQWNGSAWSLVTSPRLPGPSTLYSITAISANNVWAVGSEDNVKTGAVPALFEHYNGKVWRTMPDRRMQNCLESRPTVVITSGLLVLKVLTTG